MNGPLQPDDSSEEELTLLQRGRKLPDLALESTSGAMVSLAGLAGWSVIYCYPWTGRPECPDPPDWDNIPGAHGSTPQTLSYANLHAGFCQVGVRVFGLSTQSSAYQKEMVARLSVPFEILSDAQFAFANALALPRFETGGVTYLKRLTMVVQDGTVRRVFYPVTVPETDAREMLAWISSYLSYSVEARTPGAS